MKKIITYLVPILFSLQSCTPLIIATAITQDKKATKNSSYILSTYNLEHRTNSNTRFVESSIFNNANEEIIFIRQRSLYKYGNRYSYTEHDDIFNTITYFDIIFLNEGTKIEVERYSTNEIITLLNENNVFTTNSLNNENIKKMETKYGSNSISSLVNNNPIQVNINNHQ